MVVFILVFLFSIHLNKISNHFYWFHIFVKTNISWINAISKLFPENSSERSEKYYSQAHKVLSLQNNEQRLAYILSTLERIKALLSKDQIDSIGPMIADIVEADGIVMTSEMDIVSLAEKTLDIKIEIEE